MVNESYTGFRVKVREGWNDEDWRLHRWAYAKLTEKPDSRIGLLFNALQKSAVSDSTIVVFTSDHGVMNAAHNWSTKLFFFEEAAGFLQLFPILG